MVQVSIGFHNPFRAWYWALQMSQFIDTAIFVQCNLQLLHKMLTSVKHNVKHEMNCGIKVF